MHQLSLVCKDSHGGIIGSPKRLAHRDHLARHIQLTSNLVRESDVHVAGKREGQSQRKADL